MTNNNSNLGSTQIDTTEVPSERRRVVVGSLVLSLDAELSINRTALSRPSWPDCAHTTTACCATTSAQDRPREKFLVRVSHHLGKPSRKSDNSGKAMEAKRPSNLALISSPVFMVLDLPGFWLKPPRFLNREFFLTHSREHLVLPRGSELTSPWYCLRLSLS